MRTTSPRAAVRAPRPGLTARELMTPADRLASVSPESTLRETAELLSARHVEGAPVLAGSTVVGVVSATDLLDFAASTPGAPAERTDQAEWGEWGPAAEWEEGSEAPAACFLEMWMEAGEDVAARMADASGPEWNVFDEHTAGEVMTRRVVSIHPSASAREAARSMLRAGVHRLLVMEDGRLAGLVTTTDLVRAVAAGKLVPGRRR